MVEDLNMTGHDYNVALFVFFIPYILFEVPSNIIIKRVAPSTWLSIIMVSSAKSASNETLHLNRLKVNYSRFYGVSPPLARGWSETSAA